MAIAVGITGSLGTGKTTVAAMFEACGAQVFEADKIAHGLIKKGKPCYLPLIRLLGKDILTQGRIDRRKVAKIIFQDNQLLRKVEEIIHPEVIKYIEAKIHESKKKKKSRDVLIFDVPLLFESNLDLLMDFCLVVKATQKTQVERASARLGISKRQALRRIKAQMPLKEKVLRADRVINNNKQLKDTKKQVKQIWKEILQKKQ